MSADDVVDLKYLFVCFSTGSIIILVSTNQMTSGLPDTRMTLNNVYDDIVIYKNNTFKVLFKHHVDSLSNI